MVEHLKESILTPSRVVVALLCIAFTITGMNTMERTDWKVSVTLPNVRDLAGCEALCQRTLTDDDFAVLLGGQGDCSTVSYKVCEFAASKIRGFKVQSCSADTLNTSTSVYDSAMKCKFTVSPASWKPYAVISVFVLVVLCCFQEAPPDVMLLSGAAILCTMKIISYEELFKGFSSGSVVGLALLGPISLAIEESGIMEKLILMMLGTPTSLGVAIIRMMLPVAFLSAFLSNTATVAMMIPIVVAWGRRLEVHPGQLLMPLSFAAQLGGSCTLFGSSHCLVAKDAVDASIYEMGFFDLAPLGVLLLLFTCIFIFLAVNYTSLLQSSVPTAQASESFTAHDAVDIYDFKVPNLTRTNTTPSSSSI